MLKVAVIGATGAVGQEFVIGLNKHPWFEMCKSRHQRRSAGKTIHRRTQGSIYFTPQMAQ